MNICWDRSSTTPRHVCVKPRLRDAASVIEPSVVDEKGSHPEAFQNLARMDALRLRSTGGLRRGRNATNRTTSDS
jgi:hypothetical protein